MPDTCPLCKAADVQFVADHIREDCPGADPLRERLDARETATSTPE